MNWLKHIGVVSWVVGLLLLSCAHPALRDDNGLGTNEQVRAGVDETSSLMDAWEKLENQTGEPGIDYNPRVLLVVYHSNPQPLPVEMQGVVAGTSAESVAASMPNSILRKNRKYEPITDAIATEFGLTIHQQVYQGKVNAASFRLADGADGDSLLAELRQRFAGQIEHAVYSPLHQASFLPDDEDFVTGIGGRQWALWQIGCPQAWDYELGEETVLVAVVDTGVRLTHEELAGQVLDPEVYFPGQALDVVNNDNTVEDLDGHGTFIAGMVAAAGNNTRTITGVAPGCRVLPVKIANDMSAETLDIIAGCLLAYNLGAKVINLSFSTPQELTIERDMVNEIWDGGSVVVSVAGNNGVETAEYPGAYDNAICVGGSDRNDEKWTLSNFGPTVNVAAPALGLKSCTNNENDSGYYSNGTGTSFGAAIASGALGLLFSLGPDVTNEMARQALESTGVLVDGFSGQVRRIDVGAAAEELNFNNWPVSTQLEFGTGVCGKAVRIDYLYLSSPVTANVAEVVYTLDLAPVGEVDEYDIVVSSNTGGSFVVQIEVSPDWNNQQAKVTAQTFNSYGFPGDTLEQDILIFNMLGDTDSNGVIDGLDVEFIQTKLGLTDLDPGYTIFADTNLDGIISELDLAWVGYSWGS